MFRVPLTNILPLSEARGLFSKIIEEASEKNASFIITKGGRPAVIITSVKIIEKIGSEWILVTTPEAKGPEGVSLNLLGHNEMVEDSKVKIPEMPIPPSEVILETSTESKNESESSESPFIIPHSNEEENEKNYFSETGETPENRE